MEIILGLLGAEIIPLAGMVFVGIGSIAIDILDKNAAKEKDNKKENI